jgi:hypothetical protein
MRLAERKRGRKVFVPFFGIVVGTAVKVLVLEDFGFKRA